MVTVAQRPEALWPWLEQIGRRRAGWQCYDLADQLGVPGAERPVPEFQHREVGDLLSMRAPTEALASG